MFKKALEVMQAEVFQKCLVVCLANADHPASFDHLIGPACENFFTTNSVTNSIQDVCKTSLRQFCEYLEKFMRSHEYNLKMKTENLMQNERNFEEERIDAKGWAVGELNFALPTKIPSPLWGIFREVEQLKETIAQLKENMFFAQSQNISKLNEHVENLEWCQFDLMRMYKHKPNNSIQYCGNLLLLDKLTLSSLFNV